MSANEEASPICRGKNLSWETVMLFFNYMPKEPMPKDRFNSYVEENINSWTQTHSQIARQLAFYYEDNGICYPRFNTASTLSDLFDYMVHWAHNYFVPNPFAPSLKGKKPTSIYSHLVKCIDEGITEFDTALDSLFGVPLSSHDKVRVYLQNYTNIKFDQGNISFNEGLIDNNLIKEPTVEAATNTKQYFLYFSKKAKDINREGSEDNNHFPLQQIFYGAPGTGKSHSVEEVCKEYTHFRTTFHPDSDYSTFVGCYKPVTIKKEEECYGVQKLREMYNEFHTKYPSHNISRFVGLHYKSFLKLTNDEAFAVFKDFSADTTISNILSNAIPQAEACGELMKGCDSKISYAFTPQAFTLAYIEAWRNLSKPVFLVIEEINRGNCAQIFGDLFQLLDRNEDGYSSYEIVPDTDLKNYIAAQGLKIEGVGNNNDEDISEKLMSGELMALPPNLYIWATMNTSDQSLFPIDSAFKRRWDWKYVPINTEAKSGWKIVVDGKNYSWSSFLDKINDEIDSTTSSEDKQLGFFFCKADDTDEDDNNGTISAEKFVGKVLFYIYNDVFKDYGLDQEFFKDKENAGKKISFRSLFKMNGDINETQVAKILDNLGVEILDANTDAIADEDNTEADDESNGYVSKNYELKVALDGEDIAVEGDYVAVYLETLNRIGLDKVMALDIKLYDQNILRLEAPLKHAYRMIKNYYAITFKLSKHIERILQEIKSRLSVDMQYEFIKK